MLLIRPPPLQGESLSSWRQRAGQANGFRRSPRHSYRGRNNDPDRLISNEDKDWLIEQYRYGPDVLVPLTLDHELGKYLHTRIGANQLRGTLSHAAPAARSGGHPMFCPTCLANDPLPYFRISWRIAFNTRCPVHGCQLREACPNCGHAPWPSKIQGTEPGRWPSLRFCHACGKDLGSQCENQQSSQSMRTQRIQNWFADDYGSALWFLAQLFLRKGTRQLHLYACMKRGVHHIERSPDNRRFEFLDIQQREELLDSAEWLLDDWPTQFLQGTLSCGLNLKNFSASSQFAPAWLRNAIGLHLVKRNRILSCWREG